MVRWPDEPGFAELWKHPSFREAWWTRLREDILAADEHGSEYAARYAPAAPPPPPMTAEEKMAYQAQFADKKACAHCGGLHLRACPRVRRLTFRNKEIAEVEFWPPGRWPEGDIVWPEDV